MPFHHKVLSNGLSVVAELNDSAHSIAAGFFVKTGSRDESLDVSGVSHFLEHMAFKGGGKRDALAVNRDFDRVGAKSNAQTSEEDTIYYTACLPEYLPKAFDVLSELIRPQLDENDFQTEKEVIIEEIKMYQDDPMSTAYELAKANHFANHPIGQSILGTVESITNLTIKQMRDYFANRYGAPNVTLAFAGKSDWSELADLAEAQCGGWTGGEAPRIAEPVRGRCGFAPLLRDKDNQATIIGVADAPPFENEDRYAASLLARMLGDHSGSRLYWELIDTGKADQVMVSYQEYNQAGAFLTLLSCEPDRAQDNVDLIAKVFLEASDKSFSEQELARAKNKIMAQSVIRSERPMGRLLPLGYYWVYKQEYVTVQDEIQAFAKVTLQDIRRVLDQWPLLPMTIVAAGPKPHLRTPA